MLTFGSCFAGIGGLDIGLERVGMECKWQIEWEDYCQKVLATHWPDVKRYSDIREVDANELERVDVIAGGFPCQDISVAGKGEGIQEGNRSGLWTEMSRLILVLRPRYVIVENVAMLLSRGIGRVLGDLATLGYDAEWEMLPAAAFGLPHERQRVFILAYPSDLGWDFLQNPTSTLSYRNRVQNQEQSGYRWKREACGHSVERVGWSVEPDIPGSDDGVPFRMERLKALGNAVVPQVAEFLGECIIEYEKSRKSIDGDGLKLIGGN